MSRIRGRESGSARKSAFLLPVKICYEDLRKSTNVTYQNVDVSILYVVLGVMLEMFYVLRRDHTRFTAGVATIAGPRLRAGYN